MTAPNNYFKELANIVANIEDCNVRHTVGQQVGELCFEENPFFNKDSFLEAARCIGGECDEVSQVSEMSEMSEEAPDEEEIEEDR